MASQTQQEVAEWMRVRNVLYSFPYGGSIQMQTPQAGDTPEDMFRKVADTLEALRERIADELSATAKEMGELRQMRADVDAMRRLFRA